MPQVSGRFSSRSSFARRGSLADDLYRRIDRWFAAVHANNIHAKGFRADVSQLDGKALQALFYCGGFRVMRSSYTAMHKSPPTGEAGVMVKWKIAALVQVAKDECMHPEARPSKKINEMLPACRRAIFQRNLVSADNNASRMRPYHRASPSIRPPSDRASGFEQAGFSGTRCGNSILLRLWSARYHGSAG